MRDPRWETDEEFDDGGTPMWRARYGAQNRATVRPRITIDAPPRTFREAWNRLTVQQVFLIGLFVPWAIVTGLVVGGFGYLILSDWLAGRLH
ncbi:hypothetical protein LDL36_14005 [Komagataeibacter sp. FNDCR1]|nr:hypothetical protein [Komagataeibacter sp. FNDCR1]